MQQRDTGVDVVKGLLAAGMVLAHVFQLFAIQSPASSAFTELTNLVSFSGFLLCFGFACWKAYLSRPQIPWGKVLRTAGKCYLAFVLSGVAFKVLIGQSSVTAATILPVALLRDIPGYSEFLIAFPLAVLLACAAAPLIRLATRSLEAAVLATALLGLLTLLPTDASRDPALSLFVGGPGFAFFPVLPYFPLFLLGICAARGSLRPSFPLAAAAAVGLGAFFTVGAQYAPITRFPPSAAWLGGSVCAAYLYFCAGSLLDRFARLVLRSYLIGVGRHVLVYLLVSNCVLFTMRAVRHDLLLTVTDSLLVWGALMAATRFLIGLGGYAEALHDPRPAERSESPST